jgi:hypothetical protein
MNFLFTANGLRVGRDRTDKRIRKESTVVFRILSEMNRGALRRVWVRCWPDRIGLTSCRVGIKNRKTGDIYWHGNYAVEDAAQAWWNDGQLFLNKA